MKTTDEMINSLYRRRDTYLAARRKHRTAAGAAAAAAVAGAAAAGGFLIFRPDNDTAIHTGEASSAVTSAAESTSESIISEAGSVAESVVSETDSTDETPDESKTSENEVSKAESPASEAESIAESALSEADSVDEGSAGNNGMGFTSYFFIPALPPNNELILRGEEITDEEAAAYFAENRQSLISSLAASGVPTEDFSISESGSCYIYYDGCWDEQQRGLTLIRDFRDYYAYSGDRLVAVLTVTKENGRLSCTPAFGSPSFEPMGEFFQKHKGQELVFIRAKWAEIILAPDGEEFYPGGDDLSPVLQGLEDPYGRWFYHPEAVYVP